MITFGPVPSRRLGMSLGVNIIPASKICTYSCVYCQVGLTRNYQKQRKHFYAPQVVFNQVKEHLASLDSMDTPNYLTIVSNGEPTLDIALGETLRLLKQLPIPLAVITNSSLLNMPSVRDDLMQADWVSVKVDAGNESTWKKINRPIDSIHFDTHIDGIMKFASTFKGKLATETMLVEGINDNRSDVEITASLIAQIQPDTAFISIPTRPPAVETVRPPDESVVTDAYRIFVEKGINTELILGFEGTHTGFTGNALEDIVNICTVHPIREDVMKQLLDQNNADQTLLSTLIHGKYIKEVEYQSHKYYIRQFHQ